jgi:hypothetical protein
MRNKLGFFFLMMWSSLSLALPDATQLAVWVNEAIVATYTYDYQSFLPRQREIAHYYTTPGWTAYFTALNASKLPDAVMKNKYYVSAVATLPPDVKTLSPGHWEAEMPILVIYKNPQYQQKQTLLVTVNFSASPNEGLRGLAINNLQAKVMQPPCECQAGADTSKADAKQSLSNEPPSAPLKAQ